ncbi:major facilitator superfamily domain-containing protein [Endogone sp. FLAS-F59071]|nr:major facilitator superfamily domain-containing protein [Endogone sp. FLAS-F59071]|eukprot:RUS18197.1 major facilitator superfamily domain-containing protein [Endogone sp. FLAS-F59071]
MPAPTVNRTVRVVFTALLLDILAFTIILPLFPRLLQHYRDIESGTEGTLFDCTIHLINDFKILVSTDRSGAATNAKWDLVLLGGLMGSLFSFLQFVAAPIIGRLSDWLGRRKTLLLTMIGNILSTLTWCFANTFSLFLLSRVIGGLSEGNVQLSVAIISDVTTKETRSWGLALVGIAFAVAFTIGPALGAFFASIDLRSSLPFLVEWGLNPYSAPALLALGLLTIETMYLYAFLPETSTIKRESQDNPDSKESADSTPSQTQTQTQTAAHRLRNLQALNASHFLHLLIFSGMEFTLTFLTFDVFDFTHMQQGKFLGYIGILSSLIQGGYVRRSAHRLGEKRIVVQGVTACAMGLAVIAGMVAFQGSIAWLYVGATFLAITSATVVNCLTSIASMQCDPEVESASAREQDPRLARGRALGQFRGRGQLGRALGPVVACSLYWFGGPAWCYGLGAVAMTGVVAFVCVLVPSTKEKGVEGKEAKKD